MNLGIMFGAVCAPAEAANIRANSPDDCRSATPAELVSITPPRAGEAEPSPSDEAHTLEDGS